MDKHYQPYMSDLQRAAVDAAVDALQAFTSSMALLERVLGNTLATEAQQFALEHLEELYLSDGMMFESLQSSVCKLDWLANVGGSSDREEADAPDC